MTFGENLVRLDFNPSGNTLVHDIKASTARLIDLCHANQQMDPRSAQLAISTFECAAMWAVKMATYKPPEQS